MFTIENGFYKKIHKLVDMLVLTFSFFLAFLTKKYILPLAGFSGLSDAPNYFIISLVLIISCYFSFDFVGFYHAFRRKNLPKIFKNTLSGVVLGFSVTMLLFYIIKETDVSRILLGMAFIFTYLSLLVSKVCALYIVKNQSFQDNFKTNILIVGSRDQATETIDSIQENTLIPVNIIGCLDLDEEAVGRPVRKGIPVIGTMNEYFDLLKSEAVDEIVFAMPLHLIDNVEKYIKYAEQIGVDIRFIPNWQIKKMMYQPETASTYFDQKIGTPSIVLSSKPQKEVGLMFKSVLDYMVALTVLTCLLPVLGAIALAVKLTSEGPVFFAQDRSGLGGRIFKVLKFRTMVVNAEELKDSLKDANEVDGPVFKMTKDPRITKVGSFLRKTSLDELPQLINVLKGEMSLVGPRPPIPSEVEQYETWQRRRLSMKPGLTCIWQVSGRNNIDFKSWMKMDLAYIDKWSLWLDLKLLFLTIPTVLFGTGK